MIRNVKAVRLIHNCDDVNSWYGSPVPCRKRFQKYIRTRLAYRDTRNGESRFSVSHQTDSFPSSVELHSYSFAATQRQSLVDSTTRVLSVTYCAKSFWGEPNA
ncbi:hypothetical protein OUZ56_001924 [Daphnia magna]|uniref:Uncharacterized protein n=1 Tax=Daphnia magna TaxID=35525 RepID=A0ABR0A456_9CRUS|nr:hypothetical protein OUZ56_001924 [Daphnia magna]